MRTAFNWIGLIVSLLALVFFGWLLVEMIVRDVNQWRYRRCLRQVKARIRADRVARGWQASTGSDHKGRRAVSDPEPYLTESSAIRAELVALAQRIESLRADITPRPSNDFQRQCVLRAGEQLFHALRLLNDAEKAVRHQHHLPDV